RVQTRRTRGPIGPWRQGRLLVPTQPHRGGRVPRQQDARNELRRRSGRSCRPLPDGGLAVDSSATMTGDPVAWQVIGRGWRVLDADGTEIGKVGQVTGDLNDDIFNGITVGDGGTVLTTARYVPSEHVTAIRQGEVVLDLHADDLAGLERYVAP